MNSKYSSPPKLKCTDCKLFSVYVKFNNVHKTNLCVDCFVERQIKNMGDSKKE